MKIVFLIISISPLETIFGFYLTDRIRTALLMMSMGLVFFLMAVDKLEESKGKR